MNRTESSPTSPVMRVASVAVVAAVMVVCAPSSQPDVVAGGVWGSGRTVEPKLKSASLVSAPGGGVLGVM